MIAGRLCQSRLSVNRATLEIKDSLNEIRPLNLHSVRHQHQVYGTKSLDLNSVHAIDAGKQGVWIFSHVFEVGHCNLLQEKCFLVLIHCLYDKTLVCAEEEKAARGTTCLACFEDTRRVFPRV